MSKVDTDLTLGEQDKWMVAVDFMESCDSFFKTNNLKRDFIIASLTCSEKLRLP